MNAKQRVEDLIIISERLAKLLEKENAALRAHRDGEVVELLEDKLKLARAYESRVKGLRDQPQALAEVDEEEREKLRLLGDKVRELMEENATLLKIALRISLNFMDSVAQAMRAADRKAGIYGANGSLQGGGGRGGAKALAISLDKSL